MDVLEWTRHLLRKQAGEKQQWVHKTHLLPERVALQPYAFQRRPFVTAADLRQATHRLGAMQPVPAHTHQPGSGVWVVGALHAQ
eukprot:341552-Chlamydomonas_euryale.AAC.1